MKNYYEYWGKAQKEEDGTLSYHLLVYHSLDAAAVSSILLQEEQNVLRKIFEITGIEKRLLLQFLLFVISIHDIGKYSVTFQNIVPELLRKMQNRTSSKQYQYDRARHDQLGMYLFELLLSNELADFVKNSGADIVSPKKVINILKLLINTSLGHHGIPPRDARPYLNDFFEQQDQNAALEFFNAMLAFFLREECLKAIVSVLDRDKKVSKKIFNELKPATWNLAGIFTLSDWIASGDDFHFLSGVKSIQEYWNIVKPVAEDAVRKTGVLPTPPNNKAGFSLLFPEFTNSTTFLQKTCNEIELSAGPQLYILEDLTGSGKTEAAMTLVSRMMASGLSHGCYIGLPTMATANAMYRRMGNCYRKLFEEKEKPSIVLTHGSRHLSEDFRSSILMNASDEKTISIDNRKSEINSGKYHCTSWLSDSTKKSLLADIGVGTIDQLLLSILPVRYQNLRYYGMTKKILVVDEVHAYDPYMNKLLCAVIKAHASAGGSTILLSATIPQVLKNQLIESFYTGTEEDNLYVPQNNAFPLLTKADKINGIKEIAIDSNQKNRNVNIEFVYDEEHVCSHIKKKLDKNFCISWIRNTVNDVFTAYEKLTREYGVDENDIIVFHSRFAFADRNNIEEQVLKLFGKESKQAERAGKVVIATQVIEQSLDLDFDDMVSDLAPIELIIQRAGRLHRHNRSKRGSPVLYIYSPPETNSPGADWYKRVFAKAAFVYNNTTVLWRTKEILKREKAIILPKRARVLIESVYGEDPINAPECFIENETESEGERMAQEDTADFSKLFIEEGYCRESARNEWDEEEKVSTRLTEEQSTVYLCKFDGEQVKPLYDGDFPWEMSSLKIRKGSIGEIQYPREIEKAISKVKEKRKFREDDIFLVSENQVNGLDLIVDMEFENEKITYSRSFGLRVD